LKSVLSGEVFLELSYLVMSVSVEFLKIRNGSVCDTSCYYIFNLHGGQRRVKHRLIEPHNEVQASLHRCRKVSYGVPLSYCMSRNTLNWMQDTSVLPKFWLSRYMMIPEQLI